MSPQIGLLIVQLGLPAIVSLYNSYQQETTRRELIKEHYQAFLARLQAEQDALLRYYELKFAERKETLENFYQVLHQAVESGNNDHLQVALYGILEVIKTDPLADYHNFVQAYRDPNIQLEI